MDIKICGLKTEEAVRAAVAGGATHVGFIFFAKSPRNVDVETAARLAALARSPGSHLPLDGGGRSGGAGGGEPDAPPTPALRADPPHKGEGGRPVLAVAVTVDADDASLDQIVAVMKPDMLQLHGHETPERVAAVKARYGLPVMKALSISEAADFGKLAPYKGIADRFLFDAKPPKGSELPGGNAVSFDWSLLKAIDPGLDYLLAGGIHAGNVAEAIAIASPPGLDISSGVESAPGVKDVPRIAAFFEAVKAAR